MKTTPLFCQIKANETVFYPNSPHTLIFSSSLPKADDTCRLTEFYGDIAKLCRDFCEKRLLPSLIAREENDASPHSWRYRLTVSSERLSEEILVTVSVALTDVTDRRSLYKTSQRHIWDSLGNSISRPKKRSGRKKFKKLCKKTNILT